MLKILRVGYLRKGYKRKDGTIINSTYIKPVLIKDMGLPGKGKKLIGKLNKGTLSSLGYHANVSSSKRHLALKKAVKKYKYSTVVHKLNAVKILTKNTNPKISNIFGQDIKWLQSYSRNNL